VKVFHSSQYHLQPSNKYLLQINGFYNHLTDVILQTKVVSLVQNTTTGKMDIGGVEAKADVIFSKSISAFINFTYQDGKQTQIGTVTQPGVDSSFIIPNIAKFKSNAGLAFRIEDLFTVSVIGNWVGTRQVLGTNPYGDVGGYFLTNLVISTHQLYNNKVTVSLNIRNLFNVKWLDPGLRAGDGMLLPTVLEQPGITGLFKIGFNF